MDYDQIDVLDKGIVWQAGAVDDAIDSPPFAGPLLVVCMDHGEENDQCYHCHEVTERVSDGRPGARFKAAADHPVGWPGQREGGDWLTARMAPTARVRSVAGMGGSLRRAHG